MVLWALFSFGMLKAGGWLIGVLQAQAAHYLDLSVPEAGRAGWAGWWDQVKAAINTTRDALLWLIVKLAAL